MDINKAFQLLHAGKKVALAKWGEGFHLIMKGGQIHEVRNNTMVLEPLHSIPTIWASDQTWKEITNREETTLEKNTKDLISQLESSGDHPLLVDAVTALRKTQVKVKEYYDKVADGTIEVLKNTPGVRTGFHHANQCDHCTCGPGGLCHANITTNAPRDEFKVITLSELPGYLSSFSKM